MQIKTSLLSESFAQSIFVHYSDVKNGLKIPITAKNAHIISIIPQPFLK